jgi:hypothetical protein
MRRGRPPGAQNRVNRAADHLDCLAIAELLQAQPDLSLAEAVCRITGERRPGTRARRVHARYTRMPAYYAALVRPAARSDPQFEAFTRLVCALRIDYPVKPLLQAADYLVKPLRLPGEYPVKLPLQVLEYLVSNKT